MKSLLLLTSFAMVCALHDGTCRKNLSYHPRYGYGYNISCEKLDNETLQELSTATVFNEITLTIKSSYLKPLKWKISHNLPMLREIQIENSTLSDGRLFENLRNLRSLRIESSVVDNDTLRSVKDLTNLHTLALVKNVYFTLNGGGVDKFRIDFNNSCIFRNVKQLFLENGNIERVKDVDCLKNVEKLHLDYNNINFVKLNLTRLTVLSLSYNKIKNVSELYLPIVEELNLEGNLLENLQESSFKHFTHLKILNLKSNRLKIIQSNLFSNNHNLQQLNLNNNNIFEFDINELSLSVLNLSSNKLKSLGFCSKLQHLAKLDVSSNKITEIPNHLFHNNQNLLFLNLSFNNIRNNLYSKSFFNLSNLTELYLSNANIETIPNDTFAFLCNLKSLDISNNNMKKIVNLDNLHCLTHLNVSYNKLKLIPAESINNLKQLKVFDIETNYLKSIEYFSIISELPSLQNINLRNNLFTCNFLEEMIDYFKNNSVGFTVDNRFNYDHENIAGIPCKSEETIPNGTAALSSIEIIENDNSYRVDSFLLILSLTLLIVTALLLIAGLLRKFRRRNFISDEIELLDKRRAG